MAELMCKLDWFSFTFPITMLGEKDNETTLSYLRQALNLHTDGRANALLPSALLEWQSGRGFYTHSVRDNVSLVNINWSAGNPYAQCELSGMACDVVLHSLSATELATCAKGRVTRMDIAVDIKTATTPGEFVQAGYSARFTSTAHYKTDTGETVYVGTRASERVARVYRYNPPHPRHELLRVEIELKGNAAKVACDAMQSDTFRNLADRVNAPFSWKHRLWLDGELGLSKLPARPYDRDGAGKLKWITSQVIPALRQAHQDGLIDIFDLIDTHFVDLRP